MRRRYIYVIIGSGLSICTTILNAQTGKPISGMVILTDTVADHAHKTVNEAILKNMTTKISTTPNHLGLFKINASIGDSIEITYKDMPRKTILVTSYENITVYLDRAILLEEVIINSSFDKKTNLKQIAAEYSSQKSIYFGGKPPITLLSPFGGSPITFFRELLGKDGKRVRRFNTYINQQLKNDEIDLRFNKQVIRIVIPIKDEELEAFNATYRPDVNELKKWSDYELYDYIKKSYEDFKKGNE